MLAKIKEDLLNSPETIQRILEHFGYANIKIHDNYMSFGRDEQSSAKSIVIRLKNNQYLYVMDYPRNISKDFFSYIIEQRGVTFKDVISVVNQELGITDYSYYYEPKHKSFGGFYSKVKKPTSVSPPKIYPDTELDKYDAVGNIRFLRDHISLDAQKFFGLRFDIENDAVVIPILDQFGNLMGIKERANFEVEDGALKYWYPLGCQASKTLYGYAQNYNYLTNNKVLIFEAEKSVMQCYTYGYRNAVALGSGSISRTQVRMLYEVQPSEVLFLHDVGFEKEQIIRNAEMYKNFGRFSETKVGYWNWEKSGYTEKYSPSDLGKKEFERILKEEIEYI